MNAKASVPFSKKSALLLAYRQTYYELYSEQNILLPLLLRAMAEAGKAGSGVDYYVSPTTNSGMQLKYSGSGKKSIIYSASMAVWIISSYAFEYEAQQKMFH